MPNKVHATEIKQANKPAARSLASPSKTEEQLASAPQIAAEQIRQQTYVDPRTLKPHDVLRLQRTVGNRAVNRLLATRSIQAKLTVGAAHDPYEEEADRVAGQVMRMPVDQAIAPEVHSLQRALKEEENEEIQTKRTTTADSFDASDDFENRLSATRGSGDPLPDTVREFMEPRFGADFSGVRVHTGSESAQLNREVSAQAFTLGSDIYLGEGKSDVESSPGKQLLAHELTHVVQQTGPIIRRQIGKNGDRRFVREKSTKKIYFAQWNEKWRAYDLSREETYCMQVKPDDANYVLVDEEDDEMDVLSVVPENEDESQQMGYLSEDTDAENEKATLSPFLKSYQAAWQSGARNLSESAAAKLIPGIKQNIAQLVKRAYGNKPKDEGTGMDTAAASLLPKGSRNCAACVDVNTEEGLKRYATYNNRSITNTSAFNKEREEGEPKMHAVGAHTQFGPYSLKDEHAELRSVDLVASSSQQLGSKNYNAREAVTNLDYVGIFQPCCVMCAVCFAYIGKADATRGYHIKDVQLWNWPPFILGDKQAIATILGAKAMQQIGDNEQNLQLVLRLMTTAHNNWKRFW